MFDIVIPVGGYDTSQLESQLKHTRANVVGFRKIFIIASKDFKPPKDCTTVSEDTFPFSKETVAYFHGSRKRNGWYLQQLLKIYAGIVIPGILDRYLVLDADTYFLKPTQFMIQEKCCYATGTEHHTSYFSHMTRLDPSFRRETDASGICHHMMFEVKYIREIIDIVHHRHMQPFWTVFLKMVAPEDYDTSGASEYELYFHYMIGHHPTKIQLRKLLWENTTTNPETTDNKQLDYVSWHHYSRLN